MTKTITLLSALLALCACAGTQVTRVQPLSENADAPYGNLLVISLFKSFDGRRYLEKDIVKELEGRGVKAVASTSMMDTRTPVTRETFLAMVQSIGRLDAATTNVAKWLSGVARHKLALQPCATADE